MKTLKSCAAVVLCLLFTFGGAREAQAAAAAVPQKAPAASTNSDQTVNIRVSPLGLLIGSVSADVGFKVGDAWALGPQFNYINTTIDNLAIDATMFGFRGNYYFGGEVFAEGWYIGPFASYLTVNVKDKINGMDMEGSATATSFGAIGGYHWAWENFNIDLGLGASVSNIGQIKVKNNSTGKEDNVHVGVGAGLATEFMFGWSF